MKLDYREECVKVKLESELRVPLYKGRVRIGNYEREIDLMSDTGIVCQVKGGQDLAPSGRIASYRFAEICLDYLILSATEATRKILVLTDKSMHEQFLKEIKGLVNNDIEIRYLDCD